MARAAKGQIREDGYYHDDPAIDALWRIVEMQEQIIESGFWWLVMLSVAVLSIGVLAVVK